jgi:uncharacterized membrane protein YczE
MLAEISAHNSDEIITLVVALLGVVGCGVAVYLAYLSNYVGAMVALLVGVVLLLIAL